MGNKTNIIGIQDINIKNKKVFLRCDFNVPFSKNGDIADYTRVHAVISTITYLLEQNCSIIISSHLGRPKGFEEKYSLKPIQKVLRAILRWPVFLAEGIIDIHTLKQAKDLKLGEILLLENLRFDEREKKNDKEFAKKLASMSEIYINDAFGVSHRNHTSIDMITNYFPEGKKAAGFLLQKEYIYFTDKISNPEKPFIAIVGGSKISSKLLTIKKLLQKVDKIIIGGAMANTFLKAQGYEIGNSLVENDLLYDAKQILDEAKKLDKELILPIDFIVSDILGENGNIKKVDFNEIPKEFIALDIGAKSIELFENKCKGAKMIFWNGPMGAYEFENFFYGSATIAHILATSPAVTFAGGGDSISVINKLGLSRKLDFISTGGGASLELLEGKNLIGIENLKY